MANRDSEIYFKLGGRDNREPIPTRDRDDWLIWFNDPRTVRRVALDVIGGDSSTKVSTVFFGLSSLLFQTAVFKDFIDEGGITTTVMMQDRLSETWASALVNHRIVVDTQEREVTNELVRAVGVEGHILT